MVTPLSLWPWRLPAPPAPLPRVRDILAEVAQRRGLTAEAIVGRARAPAALVAARQEVMARAVASGRSLHAIGRELDRDHTTVLHGARAHARRVARAEAARP